MAPHSSTLVWKIPSIEEPTGLQSMGSLRVGHDWGTSLSLFTFMHWRRKRQPTPVFLPGESQGRGSLVGCCLWVAQSRTQLEWLSSSSSSLEAPAYFVETKEHCDSLYNICFLRKHQILNGSKLLLRNGKKKKEILAGKDCQIGNDNFLPLFKEHQPNLN